MHGEFLSGFSFQSRRAYCTAVSFLHLAFLGSQNKSTNHNFINIITLFKDFFDSAGSCHVHAPSDVIWCLSDRLLVLRSTEYCLICVFSLQVPGRYGFILSSYRLIVYRNTWRNMAGSTWGHRRLSTFEIEFISDLQDSLDVRCLRRHDVIFGLDSD